MTIDVWLRQATADLTAADVGTARLDALVLLEDRLGIDRTRILAEPTVTIDPKKIVELEKLLKRRAGHEPLAYIRGQAEFYGREFVLTQAVLQPRPESETMVDVLKLLVADGKLLPATTGSHHADQHNAKNSTQAVRLADVGAGSGALGITAKLELESLAEVSVDLLEIDLRALKVAQINVDKYTTDAYVVRSDLLAQSTQDYDGLLCNLPYVPDDYIVNKSALYEPKIALFGGSDGLDLYRKLFQQIKKLARQPLFILTESLPMQHRTLRSIAKHSGYHLVQTDDFIQVYKSSN
jgi:release factor glutamine methyltransferase